MRTTCLLTVSQHALHRGEGVSAQGGVCPREYGRLPPVNRVTDRCKTLPCRNFVAYGNNIIYPLPKDGTHLLGNFGMLNDFYM